MTEEKKSVKVVDVVSRDRNWTQRVNSELECEKNWDQQWGYLSSGFLSSSILGFTPDHTTVKPSVTDKIHLLEKVPLYP